MKVSQTFCDCHAESENLMSNRHRKLSALCMSGQITSQSISPLPIKAAVNKSDQSISLKGDILYQVLSDQGFSLLSRQQVD